MNVIKKPFRIVYEIKDKQHKEPIVTEIRLKVGCPALRLGVMYLGYIPDNTPAKKHLLMCSTYTDGILTVEDLNNLQVLTIEDVRRILGTRSIIVYEESSR